MRGQLESLREHPELKEGLILSMLEEEREARKGHGGVEKVEEGEVMACGICLREVRKVRWGWKYPDAVAF